MSSDWDADVDPRVARTRRIVLDAVLGELAAAGYGGFTVEAVAVRAGVGKSTVYRHWAGKRDLVMDALEARNVQPDVAGEASPRQQVERLLDHLTHAMDDSPVAACLPALVEAAEHDETLAVLLADYSQQRRQPLRDAIASGAATGAFPPDIDPDLAAQALAGAVIYRRLMTRDPITHGEVTRLIDTVLGPR